MVLKLRANGLNPANRNGICAPRFLLSIRLFMKDTCYHPKMKLHWLRTLNALHAGWRRRVAAIQWGQGQERGDGKGTVALASKPHRSQHHKRFRKLHRHCLISPWQNLVNGKRYKRTFRRSKEEKKASVFQPLNEGKRRVKLAHVIHFFYEGLTHLTFK